MQDLPLNLPQMAAVPHFSRAYCSAFGLHLVAGMLELIAPGSALFGTLKGAGEGPRSLNAVISGGQEGEFDEYLHLLTLEQKLPLHTLRNVRDLYIRCFTQPVWPDWAPLTNLTRMALHFGADHPSSIVPWFVGDLKLLKIVELTSTYAALVCEHGIDKLAFILAALPILESLQVDIAAVDRDRYKGLRRDELENLEAVCREVLKLVGGRNANRILQFTMMGVHSQNTADLPDPEAKESRLVFTFESVRGLE